MSTILSLEPQLQSILDTVWRKFHDFAKDGTTIDMQQWTGFFAFDIVTKLGLGDAIGFAESGTDVEDIMKSIQGFFYLHAGMGYLPGQMWWFFNPVSKFLLQYLGPKSTQGQGKFFGWLVKQTLARLQQEDAGNPKSRKPDMLDHFISMKEPDGSEVPLPGILIEGGNLIGAGADTTAIGIAVVLGKILEHPADYRRVQKEVDAAYSSNNLASVADLTYLIAEKLPFLNACIKEATRLTPSILWQLPREAPADGVTIAGHYVPASATLSMSPVAQNRCKTIFGDDADEWKPERWLADSKMSSPERVREMDKFNVTVSLGIHKQA